MSTASHTNGGFGGSIRAAASRIKGLSALPVARQVLLWATVILVIVAWIVTLAGPPLTLSAPALWMGVAACATSVLGCAGYASRRQWLVVAVGVVANLVIGYIANSVTIPFYFDTIGTMGATIAGGPLAGLTTAVLTNAAESFQDPVLMAFTISNMIAAMGTWLLLVSRRAHRVVWLIIGGVVIGAITGFLGGVTAVQIYGSSGRRGIDSVVYILALSGADVPTWNMILSVLSDVLDKVVSLFVATAALGLFGLLSDRQDFAD